VVLKRSPSAGFDNHNHKDSQHGYHSQKVKARKRVTILPLADR